MKRSALILTGFISLFSSVARAGNSGALSLLENSDAKYASLADAGTAAVNDVAVMNYNPAGLGTMKTGQASFLYQKGITDDAFGRFMIGAPTKNGVAALSFGYYNAGSLTISDGVQTSDVNAQQDYVLGLGYSRSLGRTNLGGNIKYLRSTLAEEYTANAMAIDLGMQRAIGSRMRMGVAVQNLGKGIKYLDETDPLPTNYRFGAAYALTTGRNAATLLLDVPYFINERETRPSLGLDIPIGPLSIRAGYKQSKTNEFSVGTGFVMGKASLDYAFGLANQLNASHRISFSTRFGGAPRPVFVQRPLPQAKRVVRAKEEREDLQKNSVNSALPLNKTREVYTVAAGDTLASIAKAHYGSASNWQTIYFANKHLIDDPRSLEVGQRILIP